MFLAFLQEHKNRLKRDRAEGERYKERWEMRVRRDREEGKVHQTVSQLVGSRTGEVWRFGGFPYGFGSHLSKNPNHFLSLLLPSHSPSLSLASPSQHLLSFSHVTPPPHSSSSLFPTYVLLTRSCLESSSALKFLKYHHNGNILIIKAQQQC